MSGILYQIHACYDAMLGVCSDTVSVIGRTLPEGTHVSLNIASFLWSLNFKNSFPDHDICYI